MALSRKPAAGAARSTDSYLPAHGNGGYRVEHYDLDIDYKLAANRLTGRAVLTAVAYTFLQVERQRRPSRALTLPRVRAILQEVLTAHLFVTRPHYLQRMLKLQQVSLRI